MKKSSKRIISIIAALLVATGILAWALQPTPRTVETTVARRGPLTATVVAEGRTRVKDLYVIAAPVDGDIDRIGLKLGDSVSVGTIVAQLRPVAPRPLDDRSRAEALATVSAARYAVVQAEATQKEAAGALDHAESEFATAQKLVTQGVAPRNDLEHAGHQVEIRRQAVEAARAGVQTAGAQLKRAEAAAAPTSDVSSQPPIVIRSPIKGRVFKIVREDAGPVTMGAPLVEVGNTSIVEVTSDLLTADAMAVQAGASALVRDWGGNPLTARVRRTEPAAFTKISALGLEEQRVRVVLDLVNPPPSGLGHDFHVNVAIAVWESKDVLAIPSTSLFRSGDRWAVFSLHDGRVQMMYVEPGRSDGNKTAINRGLTEGEEIVTQPSDLLRDGMRVKTVLKVSPAKP